MSDKRQAAEETAAGAGVEGAAETRRRISEIFAEAAREAIPTKGEPEAEGGGREANAARGGDDA